LDALKLQHPRLLQHQGELREPEPIENRAVEQNDNLWVVDAAKRNGLDNVNEDIAACISSCVASVGACLKTAGEPVKAPQLRALWGY
jgi:hypothetical protein